MKELKVGKKTFACFCLPDSSRLNRVEAKLSVKQMFGSTPSRSFRLGMRLEAIASTLVAIAARVEAIAIRLVNVRG